MKKKITIEDLAVMVNRSFIEVEKKMATKDDIAQLCTELRTEMQVGFLGMNRRIDLLHEDISDLPDIREELKDHDQRLAHVERKIVSLK